MYLSWVAVLLGALLAVSHTRELMAEDSPRTAYLEVPVVGIFGIAGLVMLVVYRNWYITGYKTWDSNVGPTVKVWGKNGQRVGFPLAYFDAKPLMKHLRSQPGIKRN